MFDVGFAELFLLALIGLLVLGPERLPGVARTVGGFVRKARASWTSLRNTIESELAEADISEPLKKASEEFRQIGKNLTDVPGFTPENPKPASSEADPSSDTPSTDDTIKVSDSDKKEDA
jgi:sec-independent protein translocase protein TatB